MYVSQLLSEYIKNKKTNIKKCAEYFQMDRSTLYKIIRGERKAPSRDFILKISQYLYLTNDEKRLKAGRESVNVIRESYSLQQNIDKLERVYTEVERLRNDKL